MFKLYLIYLSSENFLVSLRAVKAFCFVLLFVVIMAGMKTFSLLFTTLVVLFHLWGKGGSPEATLR